MSISSVRLIAGLAAGGLLAAGALLPAQAASAAVTLTQIVMTPNSQSVTYADSTVTVQGTLETRGTTPQPLAGQQVTLSLELGDGHVTVPLGTQTTGSSGQFSVTATAPAPGYIEASFAGTATYFRTYGVSHIVNADAASPMPAEIVFGSVPPTPVYSQLTVTGQVLMQLPDGTWVPSPYAGLLVVAGEDVVPSSGPNANGDFSVSFRVDPSVDLQLFTSAYDGSWSGDAASAPLIVPLSVFPTQAQLFATQSIEDLRHMSFTGTVDYVNSQDQALPDAGATVTLKYAPLASSTWLPVATATTNSAGEVNFHVSGYLPGGRLALASGVWEIFWPATTTKLAGNSAFTVEQVDEPVWLNDVRITHTGKRAYLTGTLDDNHRTGPVAGQLVTITWGHHKATAKTGASGEFRFLLTGRPAGIYTVSYAGGPMPGGAFIPAVRGEHARVSYRV
jgi:hypothetical protein